MKPSACLGSRALLAVSGGLTPRGDRDRGDSRGDSRGEAAAAAVDRSSTITSSAAARASIIRRSAAGGPTIGWRCDPGAYLDEVVPLLGGLLPPPGRRSCAVVGSSAMLRLAPKGHEIDAHALVWRLNNAPTVGFEELVGRRTSVRVINHVPLEKWLLRARNRSHLLHRTCTKRGCDGVEYARPRVTCGQSDGVPPADHV